MKCRVRVGHAGINGTLDQCAAIESYSITPADVLLGGTITLTAAAMDTENRPLTYSWNATEGAVADSNAANTTYRCTVPGAATLTLTVTNGVCPDTVSASVMCIAAGMGGSDAGPDGH